MPRKVILAPYNPEWQFQYQHEVDRLRPIFGELARNFYHVGSTAVPGIMAKPIIDIMVEVSAIEPVDELNPQMEALGYHPRGEYGVPGRRYFFLGIESLHTVHVHVFAMGNPEIRRHVDFRDYLRAHPQAALEYSELKLRLAQRYPDDTSSYTEAKTAFVDGIDQKAIQWREQHQ